MIWLVMVSPEHYFAATLDPWRRISMNSSSPVCSPSARLHQRDLIRIYCAVGGTTVVFRAELKKSPIQGRDYVYFLADLKMDTTPPALPSPDSNWRKPTWSGVRLGPTWSRPRLGADACRALAGAYFRLLSQERILYRDDANRYGRFASIKSRACRNRAQLLS